MYAALLLMPLDGVISFPGAKSCDKWMVRNILAWVTGSQIRISYFSQIIMSLSIYLDYEQ